MACLDTPDPQLDKLWAEVAESRLDAFKKGELGPVTLESVLSKYK
jgi:hypothetical protein